YAIVSNSDASNYSGTLDGLYVTKDFGQNWTKISLFKLAPNDATPTNDPTTGATFNVIDGSAVPGGKGNYDLSITADPNNPMILSLAGPGWATGDSIIRVDTPRVYDAHAFYTPLDSSSGALSQSVASSVATKNPNNKGVGNPWGDGTLNAGDQYINL